jgi:hypothetical protein
VKVGLANLRDHLSCAVAFLDDGGHGRLHLTKIIRGADADELLYQLGWNVLRANMQSN